ncbi:MAG TPA: hypothetical protein VMG08_03970 [Allosphingosinicella sp.]|nr:hypothetical protein [Allosphingosinicella sp.]
MRTGRLSISRGHRREETEDKAPPQLALVPPALPAAAEAVPPSRDYQAVNERLDAMERLVRLYELGALTPEEFAAEKLLILGDPPRVTPVHFVPAAPRGRQRGPSLLGRILSWQFLLLTVVAGIAFSFAAQPEATTRFATQLWRAIAG